MHWAIENGQKILVRFIWVISLTDACYLLFSMKIIIYSSPPILYHSKDIKGSVCQDDLIMITIGTEYLANVFSNYHKIVFDA